MTWFLIDDQPEEARAFADQLSKGPTPLRLAAMLPAEARATLLSGQITPTGLLVDIDLSNAEGERGSGPGLAQDLRVKQRAGEVGEFPIVRFSARAPIERNVKGDPGSDDLFDLKILKETVAQDVRGSQQKLLGLERVYEGLSEADPQNKDALPRLLGLSDTLLIRWSTVSFHDRLLSALQVATHVAAGAFMRGFLSATGLLLSDVVVSYRLGIDMAASDGWRTLIESLPNGYTGIAKDFYARWWARGLDDWWFETMKCERALASMTIEERVEKLKESFGGLIPLRMPEGSAGNCPWRVCSLGLEADPPQYIPIDPAESVRVTPRDDVPPWVDPHQASLRLALQNRDDRRLNRSDLARLEAKHRVKTA
jgi:hypothetical protein